MTDILQFGTSRFLQAHADLFFSESGTPREVTVVQSSGDPSRRKRLDALADPAGYPVRVRGLMNGREIDETRTVISVKRTLSTATDWEEVREAAIKARIIISNTADNGYQPQPADTDPVASQAMSYPAKLFHLLAARFQAGGEPVTVMPTELIPENGRVLKERVLEIARQQRATGMLIAWLEETPFANSLVDRIVSEALEPAGAVAEPYALWAIEAAPGITAPCAHDCVQLVDDLEKIERLKLHILNLGHTVLAQLWREAGADKNALVREAVAGPDGAFLDTLWKEEVLAGFEAAGMGDEAARYVAVTRERFQNPFLDHKLADIAGNHAEKARRRIGAFMEWSAGNGAPAMPRLKAILGKAEQ